VAKKMSDTGCARKVGELKAKLLPLCKTESPGRLRVLPLNKIPEQNDRIRATGTIRPKFTGKEEPASETGLPTPGFEDHAVLEPLHRFRIVLLLKSAGELSGDPQPRLTGNLVQLILVDSDREEGRASAHVRPEILLRPRQTLCQAKHRCQP
jgi:hypothetical protein